MAFPFETVTAAVGGRNALLVLGTAYCGPKVIDAMPSRIFDHEVVSDLQRCMRIAHDLEPRAVHLFRQLSCIIRRGAVPRNPVNATRRPLAQVVAALPGCMAGLWAKFQDKGRVPNPLIHTLVNFLRHGGVAEEELVPIWSTLKAANMQAPLKGTLEQKIKSDERDVRSVFGRRRAEMRPVGCAWVWEGRSSVHKPFDWIRCPHKYAAAGDIEDMPMRRVDKCVAQCRAAGGDVSEMVLWWSPVHYSNARLGAAAAAAAAAPES
jgi:hypothetical protein